MTNTELKEAPLETEESSQEIIENQATDRVKASIGTALKKAVEGNKKGVEVHTYTPEKIDEALITRLSETFRYTFNNVFPEFVVCQPCGEQLSAKTVFNSQDEEVPLEIMDALKNLPCCPQCNEQMEIFHDPEEVRKKLEKKLKGNAQLTIITENDSNKILGFAIGYEEDLKTIFQNEWQYKYTYTKEKRDDLQRDFEQLKESIRENLEPSYFGKETEEEIDGESKAYCLACVVLSPDLRGSGKLLKLLKEFFGNIPEKTRQERPVMSEVIKESKSHVIMRQCCPYEVENFLSKELIILMGSLEKLSNRFLRERKK